MTEYKASIKALENNKSWFSHECQNICQRNAALSKELATTHTRLSTLDSEKSAQQQRSKRVSQKFNKSALYLSNLEKDHGKTQAELDSLTTKLRG